MNYQLSMNFFATFFLREKLVMSLLQVTENIGYGVIRTLYSLLQVIENIGYGVVRKLYSKIRPDPSDPHADPIARVIKCAQVPSMPKPVIRAILQVKF